MAVIKSLKIDVTESNIQSGWYLPTFYEVEFFDGNGNKIPYNTIVSSIDSSNVYQGAVLDRLFDGVYYFE